MLISLPFPDSRVMPFRLLLTATLAAAVVAPALGSEPREVRYHWLTQGEPSGSLVTRIEANGTQSSTFEFNDRGRGPSQRETVEVDADGLIRRLRIEGRSYMGSPVDEQFDSIDGGVRWRSTLDQGERAPAEPAFYLANAGTPQQLALLARALLAAEGGRLPLLPSGEAAIELLASESLEHDGQAREVNLYAISGLGFTPSYVWLDGERNLFALSYGWMGLTPEGWAPVFARIRERQEATEGEYLQRLAARLTERLPAHWCITPVRLLDVDRGRYVENASVRVRDGVIEAVDADAAEGCADAQRIDGGGRVLIPGLWDMHAHLSPSDGLLNIAAGVTGARDLANDHDQLLRLIGQFERGELIGPRVQRAGFIDQKSPYTAPTGRPVETLERALAEIDRYAELGYPQIKIYSSITPDWVRPIAEHIHARGMKLSGHIPAFMTAERAVREGFDEIQHVNMLFLNFLAGTEADTRTPVRFELVAERGGTLDLDAPEVRAFIALLKERDVIVDPTVSIFDEMFRHRSGQVSPSLAAVAAHLPPNVQRAALAGRLAIDDGNAARYAASAEALLAMLKKLHDAGVRMVPGTDDIPGFTLHRELELYAQAGIPHAEVLRMATAGAATIAGFGAQVGRIAPGQAADLVLIDGDPLAEIGALRRAMRVFRGDRMYRPARIHRAIGVRPFVAEP